MRYSILLIFIPPLLLGLIGVMFTSNKLDRMRQIRGIKPGATIEIHSISNKSFERPDTHTISWTAQSGRAPGNHRLRFPESVWKQFEIGDEVEIVFLPNDSSPYHRDDIYASDENFLFDYGLLALEIGMVAFAFIGAPATFWLLQRFGKRLDNMAFFE